MNKLKTAVVVGALIAFPLLGFAQAGGVTPVTIPEQVNVPDLLGRIINWAFGLLLLLAAVFIVVAAYYYLTSGGDEEYIKSAKNYLLYAIVSIVIAFLARGIVYIVRQLLGVV